MQKNESVNKYELMLIIDAKLTSDAKESVYKEILEVVKKNGGKIINSQVWLEKHKMTFTIKRCSEGTYYLINFESQTPAIEKITAVLRLNERILRYVVIDAQEQQPAAAAQPAHS